MLRLIKTKKDSYASSMGKNDLWIAAAASAMNSTLVTTDKDFDHLQPAYISSIDWIDPEQFRK